ncbi:hypothetical protein [Palleronia sediminis]|uniref:hypothetical protein n=1 Tax=Palleronia sediminis TaxID=2547833 RepID=UPI001454E605|nr:hypothetical protein [Palleronia sediminis]
MNKKMKKSKSKSCTAKRLKSKLVMIVTHIFETLWATGAGVTAAMVFSAPIYSRRV